VNNCGDYNKHGNERYLKTDKKGCDSVLGRNKGCGKKLN